MAIPISIKDLLEKRKVESERIEFKANWNPEEVMHTVCAFANDINNWGGGYIVIGVSEEDGLPVLPPVGMTKGLVEKINKELLNVCNLIEPRYIPVSDVVYYEDKQLFLLWAPGGTARPYKCPDYLGKDGKGKTVKSPSSYYIRKLANTIKANEKEVKELFEIASSIPFDDCPNFKADIDDLRHPLITKYLHDVESDLYEAAKTMPVAELAENLHIIDSTTEFMKPLNVGLLFFNERPDNFFRYARIEVVDKPDPTGVGMTEKYFYGPLDTQLRDALNYIRSYILQEKTFKYNGIPESQRFFNYPYDAIEEALANAVHHRGYDIPEPIIVTNTPDYIEVSSHPGPDRSISDKDLRERRLISRRYRNRRIGDFLKELDMVEGRNTGIPRIIRSLSQNGSDLPIFETDEERSYFVVRFNVHPSFKVAYVNGIIDGIGKTEQRIIALMARNPDITVAEIAKSISRSPSTVHRLIATLKKSGLIMRVGSNKTGHWETLG